MQFLAQNHRLPISATVQVLGVLLRARTLATLRKLRLTLLIRHLLYFYFMCISVLPECKCAHHACGWCPRKPEEGFGYPETRITHHHEASSSQLSRTPAQLSKQGIQTDGLAAGNELNAAISEVHTHRSLQSALGPGAPEQRHAGFLPCASFSLASSAASFTPASKQLPLMPPS
ncbi:uncharacterized protein LOC143274063 [Peromyscus maniculatus bairdii]|uniref:uncharacterized protein LOC143274063 n=1 Tax=Peromyscus maniculatus bairdii TaxID=230844 RepID=UPI003FD4C35B